MTRRFMSIGLGAWLLSTAALTTQAQIAPRKPAPPVLIESLGGRENFERYCATCHGLDGRGNGPVAPALVTRPADLTRLAARDGGAFPRSRVVAFVTGSGRPVAAHGSAAMPIWGPIFRGLDTSETRARQRVDSIVDHIASLQAPSTAAQDPGAQLFKRHCANCHGADGRGAGIASARLGRVPPDLTKYTSRNGGVFPSERVYRIVDGRDVAAHGSHEMPVWGDVFRRDAAAERTVRSLIDAIVRYLAGLQERAG